MKIRRFYGKDMREALNQVKEELGSEAVIMSTRKQDNGIELVAAYDKESIAVSSVKASKPTPTLSEIIGDSGPDSLRELLEKQKSSPEIAQKSASADLKPVLNSNQQPVKNVHQVDHSPPSYAATNNSAAQPEVTTTLPAQLDDMKAELASLRNKIS